MDINASAVCGVCGGHIYKITSDIIRFSLEDGGYTVIGYSHDSHDYAEALAPLRAAIQEVRDAS
jgi:hypothetical protein